MVLMRKGPFRGAGKGGGGLGWEMHGMGKPWYPTDTNPLKKQLPAEWTGTTYTNPQAHFIRSVIHHQSFSQWFLISKESPTSEPLALAQASHQVLSENALKINFPSAPQATGPYDPEATSTAVALPRISTTKTQSIPCESLGNHSSAMLLIEWATVKQATIRFREVLRYAL